MPDFGPDVRLDRPAYVDPTARLYGKITAEPDVSIWPYAVIRAELHDVWIGRGSNIQDHVMIHVAWGGPTLIGAHCSIAHRATLHGCRIGNHCLIGIGATVMDGCVIGDNCVIAGHAFVKENTVIPDNSIVMGTPARVTARRNNFISNKLNALIYERNGRAYAVGDYRAWSGPDFDAFLADKRETLEIEYAHRYGITEPA
ncbi:gamma carbonic anhydrase family protein [Magnetospira thiophila]